MADNYIAGKSGYVTIAIGTQTLNPVTGALTGTITVTGAAASGGLIRLAVSSTVGLVTGMMVEVAGVVGTVEANGTWEITVIDATHIDLVASVFANAYVSGGNVVGPAFSFDKWGLAINCHLPDITNFTSQGFRAMLAGIFSGDISVSGPYNRGNMPFAAGVMYVWVLGFTPLISLNVPGIIDKISIDNDVKEFPKISITAKSSGRFLASIA